MEYNAFLWETWWKLSLFVIFILFIFGIFYQSPQVRTLLGRRIHSLQGEGPNPAPFTASSPEMIFVTIQHPTSVSTIGSCHPSKIKLKKKKKKTEAENFSNIAMGRQSAALSSVWSEDRLKIYVCYPTCYFKNQNDASSIKEESSWFVE